MPIDSSWDLIYIKRKKTGELLGYGCLCLFVCNASIYGRINPGFITQINLSLSFLVKTQCKNYCNEKRYMHTTYKYKTTIDSLLVPSNSNNASISPWKHDIPCLSKVLTLQNGIRCNEFDVALK